MDQRRITYTFANPTRRETFERVFRQILIDKLVAQRQEKPAAE